MRLVSPRTRRGPAVFLGLALAGFAAACTAQATAPTAPVVCAVAVDAIPGGTRIQGQVTANRAVNGTYAMDVTSRSSGGSASIRQSGDFTARAGETTRFGSTELTGTPAHQQVDLEIRVDGQRLSCARPL